jgi:hypothetical protein
VLELAEPGAIVLLNSPYGPADVWAHLPRPVQETLLERRLRLWQDVGGVEGEQDLHIDIRRFRLLDELYHLGALLDRDLPRLEVTKLGVELMLLRLASRRRRIEAAGLNRSQAFHKRIGALHVLSLRREEGESG